MERIRVILVDDEPLFREMLGRILSSEPGLEIVGEAEDGETAVRLAHKLKPDVVLMDIEMPGKLDGIEAAMAIKQERPKTGVVILSAHRDRRYVMSLPLEASRGWAYLLKQSVPDIDAVCRGEGRDRLQSRHGSARPCGNRQPATQERFVTVKADPEAVGSDGDARPGL